jgi:hypothetical protein
VDSDILSRIYRFSVLVEYELAMFSTLRAAVHVYICM